MRNEGGMEGRHIHYRCVCIRRFKHPEISIVRGLVLQSVTVSRPQSGVRMGDWGAVRLTTSFQSLMKDFCFLLKKGLMFQGLVLRKQCVLL